MIQKKSQAALEFIMTYGWAILVVLVAIGALAYFGVLSPDKFLPSKCVLQAGLACQDHLVRATSLTIVFRNSLGYDINVDAIKAQQCTAIGSQGILRNAVLQSYDLVCTNPGSKYNGNVNVTYTNLDTNLQHTNQGSVTSRIQE